MGDPLEEYSRRVEQRMWGEICNPAQLTEALNSPVNTYTNAPRQDKSWTAESLLESMKRFKEITPPLSKAIVVQEKAWHTFLEDKTITECVGFYDRLSGMVVLTWKDLEQLVEIMRKDKDWRNLYIYTTEIENNQVALARNIVTLEGMTGVKMEPNPYLKGLHEGTVEGK